ncbi:MAG: hypothetical protein HKN19_13350 [Halioglobus sp.]|nr:hypothetical protein [Halioglobus sp.]
MNFRKLLSRCAIFFTCLVNMNAHADLIGVDFGLGGQATPTNWTSVSAAGTYSALGTESGVASAVGLVVSPLVGGPPISFGVTPNAGTIPSHSNSLANIGGSIYQNGATSQLELRFTGLDAGRDYNVWLFGIRFGAAGTSQSVSIQGDGAPIIFTQTAPSEDLVVNSTIGNSATDLSTYAVVVTAPIGGEITTTVTADAISNLYAVAGIAIDLVPVLTVSTQAVTAIDATTAVGNGNISELGTSNPTQYGVCWNTTGTPTTADSCSTEGATAATGPFTSNMLGLVPGTMYFVRAYATDPGGTAYGSEVSFTTSAAPPIVPVPALGGWSLVIVSLLLALIGQAAMGRRTSAPG